MKLKANWLSVPFLLSALALAHEEVRPAPHVSASWRCPCAPELCAPVSATYRAQSFGFLDLSQPPGRATWRSLPALTALVLSHEALDDEAAILGAINSSLPHLFCLAQKHGVRLFYRLRLSEAFSTAVQRLSAVFALLPVDGVSLRLDEALLGSAGSAKNVTSLIIGAVRRLQPSAWVMLEQPNLTCPACDWMSGLPKTMLDFIYLPAYHDSDCPTTGFASVAEVEQRLNTVDSALSARLVLGVALYGLQFDCASAAGDSCAKSAVCPFRVTPRDFDAVGAGLRRVGHFFQRTEAVSRRDVFAALRLARSHALAGLGLFRVNDLRSNASQQLWPEVGRYKEVVAEPPRLDEMYALFFFIILMLVIF